MPGTDASMAAVDPIVTVSLTVAAGYVLGSVPVADLVARRRGAADLRTVGDRNPGYWNAKESLGRRAAVPVFVGDVAKGALASGVGRWPTAGGARIRGRIRRRNWDMRGRCSLAAVTSVLVRGCRPRRVASDGRRRHQVLLVVAARHVPSPGRRAGFAVPFVQLAVDGAPHPPPGA
jgi:glycerol-3-phosphate acyltransferase PlsY